TALRGAGGTSGGSMNDIVPLGNRLTLQAPRAPTKIGSLWLPQQARDVYTLCQAEIVAVGRDVHDARLQPRVKVIVKRFGAFAHDRERSTFTVYEEAILAIVNEEAL